MTGPVKTRKNVRNGTKRGEDTPDTFVFMLRAMAERGKPCASLMSLDASARAKVHVPRTGQFAVKRKRLSDEQQQTLLFKRGMSFFSGGWQRMKKGICLARSGIITVRGRLLWVDGERRFWSIYLVAHRLIYFS